MKKSEYNELLSFTSVYFIGIGGIGMSALARYLNNKGWKIGGYDKTISSLTQQLETENIYIHYEDNIGDIPTQFLHPTETLVVYTPAIPKDMGELLYFQQQQFSVIKRAELLGLITGQSYALGVAGTHGKTTTSSMLAYVLSQSSQPCDAFLGGISANFESNLLLSESARFTVVEADEFDRSFLQLHPYASIITSMDPDHLDIYNNPATFHEVFQSYADLTNKDGFLVIKEGLPLQSQVKTLRYGMESPEADYSGINVRFEKGQFLMDIEAGTTKFEAVSLGIPGWHNAENALAVWAMCATLGLSEAEIRNGIATFRGVKRRFEYIFKSDRVIYIDDYAHHPTEINALLHSIRDMYPNKRVTGIFQPHLYSRTQDFFFEFAQALSALDHLMLLPVYAAREQPIPNVNSEALLAEVNLAKKELLTPEEAVERCKEIEGILLTIGAGDIDRLVEPIKQRLT